MPKVDLIMFQARQLVLNRAFPTRNKTSAYPKSALRYSQVETGWLKLIFENSLRSDYHLSLNHCPDALTW